MAMPPLGPHGFQGRDDGGEAAAVQKVHRRKIEDDPVDPAADQVQHLVFEFAAGGQIQPLVQHPGHNHRILMDRFDIQGNLRRRDPLLFLQPIDPMEDEQPR